MIIKDSFKNKNYFLVFKLLLLIFFLLIILFIIPFQYYRDFSKSIILTTKNFHGIHENILLNNKFYNVSKRFEKPIDIIINYVKSFFIHRDAYNINISMENYQKLNYRIFLAKKRGHINREDKNVEVDANILFENKNYKSKLRLKGYYLDHAIDNKWSFRVKLKNNQTINGLNRFSLHNPVTRNFHLESLYHKTLKYLGLMYLEYYFLDLYINGNEIGVYAIEEFMHGNLIEKNKRRDGILLRDHNFLFNAKKVLNNPILMNIYKDYKKFLYQYNNKKI